MKNLLFAATLILSFLATDATFGRGRSSVVSRPSFSRPSSPKVSSPAKPSASPSKPSTPSAKPFTSSKRPTSSPTKSVDTKAYEAAKASGKAFPTKQAAVTDFKAKAKTDPKIQSQLAKDYPTSYAKEPATRPAHIPATYNSHTVVYQNGGYGYMSGGAWCPLTSYMLLDTMSDAMMMSSMRSHGYHIGPAPTTVVHTGWSGWTIFFVVVITLIGLVVFIAVMSSIRV